MHYVAILVVALSNCFLPMLGQLGDEGVGVMVGYYVGQATVISLWMGWGTGTFRRRAFHWAITGICFSFGAWLPSLWAEGTDVFSLDGTQTLAYIVVPMCCVCFATLWFAILRRYGNWRLIRAKIPPDSDPERSTAAHFVTLGALAGALCWLWILSPSELPEYFVSTVVSSFVLSLLSLTRTCFGAMKLLRKPTASVPRLLGTSSTISFLLARLFPGMAPGASGVVYLYGAAFASGIVSLLLTSIAMLVWRANGIELYHENMVVSSHRNRCQDASD